MRTKEAAAAARLRERLNGGPDLKPAAFRARAANPFP
jgi:hypothetical protein